jgi:hypothetical protein
MAEQGFSNEMPSMQFIAPSGMGIVGPDSQINSPVAASTGATVQQSQQMLSGSDKNTPPGPPIFKWNKYDLCWNAYWGTGGYYDGTVLRKMLVEVDDQYLLRRALTFYRNFFKQIIDATYKPVFSEGITRSVKVNEVEDKEGTLAPFWNDFMCNVDNRHHGIGQFTKRIVKNARILGVCYVVVDNYPDIPVLVKDALKDRKYPYVYIRLPQQVEEKMVILDDFSKIQQIVFKEAPVEVTDADTKVVSKEKRWRKWTTEYSVMLREDKNTKELIEITDTLRNYDLNGEVPVIPVMSSEVEDDTVLPHPSFYDICRCNWAIFNWDSFEARTICASMYPVLTLPRPSGTEISNLQAMNPQQGLFVPPAENGTTPAQPRWLDYPVTCFEAVDKYIQTLIDDLFRQAGQMGINGNSSKVQSGLSKSYDFHAQNYVLKESSKMAKNCELEIARIFQLYVVNEKFDYDVHYEEDFEPEEDPVAEVKLYGDYIALQPGLKGKALAMKMLAYSLFDDAEPDDVQAVIDEIEENLTNDLKDNQDIPPEGKETPEEKAFREAQQAAIDAAMPGMTKEQIAAAEAATAAAKNPPPPPKKVAKGTPKRGFTLTKKKKG